METDPFPHLFIEDALDERLYAELDRQYPREDLIRSAKQVAYRDQLMARDVLDHPEIHAAWKDFVHFHISPEFFREAVSFFAPWIRRLYPWLEEELGKPLESFSVGIRDPEAPSLPDVCLDCQPGLNTVTLTPATPRSPHLDASNKLLTGLLYMRQDGDSSHGGDFLLYRLKSPTPRFESPTTIVPADLEQARTVPFKKNCAVFFMNSPVSIHGVSVREGTPIPRRLVNWIAGCYTMKRKIFYPSPPPTEMMTGIRF